MTTPNCFPESKKSRRASPPLIRGGHFLKIRRIFRAESDLIFFMKECFVDYNKFVRQIPDFPKKGILFYDLMPLFGSQEAFPHLVEHLVAPYRGQGITKIIGIEARGFILAAPMASALGAGFVPVRKKGKLPGAVQEVRYDLEYGQDTIAIQDGAIARGEKVLLVDDLLATGGTAQAALKLLRLAGAQVEEVLFVAELLGLSGRDRLSGEKVRSILTFQL